MTTETTRTDSPVRRRRVYYISGFDPRGARFYHQLYTTEAKRQAPINGYQYTVGRRQKTGQHAVTWSIFASAEGAPVGAPGTETRYTFLSWDDLVRANWPAKTWQLLVGMPGFYARYLAHGGLAKTWRLVPRCFGALVSPLVYLFLAMGAVAAISGAVYCLVLQLLTAGGLVWALAAAAGVLTAAGVARVALAGAEKLRLPWLMRIFLFVPQWGRSPGGALAARWDLMAAQIAADLAADAAQTPAARAEEVLIIGHSVGALAALCVVDGLLQRTDGQLLPPSIKLLTFGNVTPLMGFVPQAHWFRATLARLGQAGVRWKDYSDPADPLCYALVNPFVACGLAPSLGASLQIKSSRFGKMLTPAEHARRRRDAFGIHFQYLMATQLPVDNDYFTLTAGPQQLAVQPSPLTARESAP